MFNHHLRLVFRSFSTKASATVKSRPQFKAQLEEEFLQKLQNHELPPRKHPGANLQKVAYLPPRIVNAIEKAIGDHPVKKLNTDGRALEQYLKARHPPTEEQNILNRAKQIQIEIEEKLNVDITKLNDEQFDQYKKFVKRKTEKTLKERTFGWKALDYDEYRSRMYLFARSVADYAAIKSVFNEIQRRDGNFKPKSFFDFGSGVGTGTWALNEFWKDIFEYYCVDSSGPMNDLAELILKDGEDNKERTLRNVYYRQYLGAPTTSYDIVLSAFSLIELPNRKSRLEVLTNLWTRCSGYLVLIELGSNAGFKLIAEARNFINNLKGDDGHLFAPCPQELPCPRIKLNDGTPCNFEVRFNPIQFHKHDGKVLNDRFSYVVFRKGPRFDPQWPRVVRETKVRPKHCFCNLCTESGELRELIVTPKKHGKEVYQCTRSTKWGDRLPIEIENIDADGE